MIDKAMSLLEQRRQELDQARAEYQYSVEKMHEEKQRANDLRAEYEEFKAYYNNRVMRRDNINAQLREARRDIANLEKSLKEAKIKLVELETRAKTIIRPEAIQAGKAFELVQASYRWALSQLENSKKAVHLATEKTKSAETAYRLAGGRLSREEMLAESNPWKSGSFYLVAIVIILAILGIIAANLPFYALGTVIIGGILALSIVGALQLRQDAVLSEENFLKLMIETFKRLPLLSRVTSASESTNEKQEGARDEES